MSHALILLLSLTTGTGHWPGFLGAGASPIDPAAVPQTWSPESIAWTKEIPGYGQSSPVILDGKVIVTSVEGENKEVLHVVCFDLESGELAWDHTAESTYPEKSSVYISRAAPTPVIDKQGVYAYFESGDVIALSHAGKPLWSRSLTKDYGAPTNKFGLSASPVQTDDRVIIMIDDEATAYVLALDKATGKTLWKSDRKGRKSWTSPMLTTIDGQPQVICSSDGSIDGYDVDTGKLLWSHTDIGGNSGTTPMPVGDGQFLIGATGGSDGRNAEMAKKSNGLFEVHREGDGWKTELVWKSADLSTSWASPMAHNGHAYWINRVGAVFCRNVENGEDVYTERINQSAWATPVGIGDQIYVFGRDGMTSIIAAGPNFEVIAENQFWSEDKPPVNRTPTAKEETEQRRQFATRFSRPTVYGVAIVNGAIVARTGSQIFCIRK